MCKELPKKGGKSMKKMTKAEMRQANGGKTYQCRGCGSKPSWCWYTTKLACNLGWHFIQWHHSNGKDCWYTTY